MLLNKVVIKGEVFCQKGSSSGKRFIFMGASVGSKGAASWKVEQIHNGKGKGPSNGRVVFGRPICSRNIIIPEVNVLKGVANPEIPDTDEVAE